jgi:hypothetical protein
MLVNLPFLLLALLLLWFPRQWMRLGVAMRNRRSKRSEAAVRRDEEPWNTREPGNPSVGFRSEFIKVRNYVDLLRGAAGGLAVMGGLGIDACLSVAEGASTVEGEKLIALQLAILLVGLLIQTVRYERQRLLFFAPIFFLFGLSVALCGLKGSVFAFVMIWAINPMLQNPQAFLSVYSLLMCLFGWLFGFGNTLPIAALLFCFLPVLLSMLAQRPLVLFTRKTTRAHGAEP